jgi:glutamine amidotransferase
MIAIIDYDIGNIAAVENMLKRIGAPCVITSSINVIESASKIILPGNGAFDACMSALRGSGLLPILEHQVMQEKVPLLGICVGAQMLGTQSEEGVETGLGWIDMKIKRLPEMQGICIPNMGWRYVQKNEKHQLFANEMDVNPKFYFVHSYYMEVENQDEVLFKTHYGIDYAAGVIKDNIIGVQFHPEKSHRYGKQLFQTFAGINT